MSLILAQAARWTLLGIVLGAVGSLLVTPFIRALLFEVPASDYTSLALSVFSLLVVAMLAASIPSRRAAMTDPLVALRHE